MTAENRMDAVFAPLDDRTFTSSLLNTWPSGPSDYLVFVATSHNRDLIRKVAARHPCRQVMLDHYIEGLGITGVVDDGYAIAPGCPMNDIDGRLRPIHNTADLGAVEFVPVAGTTLLFR